MPIDILIYAGVTVVLVVWLSRTIGTRHGDERQKPNPFAQTAQVVDLPKLEQRARLSQPVGQGLESGLVQIAAMDSEFDARRFAEQAKDAFLFVVEAFAKGDRETLRELLTPAVYTHFEREITTRERAGEKLETEIRAFQLAELTEAYVQNQQAFVTVKFKVEEIYAVITAEGAVRAGDRTRPILLTDVWTFTKDLKTRDPRWFVSATRPDTSANEVRAG